MLRFLVFLFWLSSCAHVNEKNDQVMAYLWYQRSGEAKALFYQAFNAARESLDKSLEKKHEKKLAIIFDIDETILDNSFMGANEVKNNLPFSMQRFKDWEESLKANAICGVKDLMAYALSKGIEIFYVTNRKSHEKEATFLNFKKEQIPFKAENVYFLEDEWSKEKRRDIIRHRYEVVLYLGDSLPDFDRDFDTLDEEKRNLMVDEHRQDFGRRFIILPNPLYGDWQKSLPKVKNKLDLLITR